MCSSRQEVMRVLCRAGAGVLESQEPWVMTELFAVVAVGDV